MDFKNFCENLGIIIPADLPTNRWVRVDTRGKKGKRNGAVRYSGDWGLAQNWEVMSKPMVWRADGCEVDYTAIRKASEADAYRREKEEKKAAEKAAWIVRNCVRGTGGDYMSRKGLYGYRPLIYKGMIVIPTRDKEKLTGVQFIHGDGEKRFTKGQKTIGSWHDIRVKGGGTLLCCEGYATAVSIAIVCASINLRATVRSCLSARNLAYVGRFNECFVLADNDRAGVEAAEESGKKYIKPDEDGDDFNDVFVKDKASLAAALEHLARKNLDGSKENDPSRETSKI